LRERSRAFVLV